MKPIILIALLLLCWSQTGLSLSLDSAIERGLATSEDLAIKKVQIEQFSLKVANIRSSLFPQIGGSFQASKYLQKPTIQIPEELKPLLQGAANQNNIPLEAIPDEVSLAQNYSGKATVGFNQVLFTFGALSNAIDAARKGLRLAELDKKSTERELTEIIKNAYFQALAADLSLKIAEGSLRNAKNSGDLLNRGVRGGRSSKSNLIRIKTDIQSRKPIVTQKKLVRETSYEYLRTLLGIKSGTPLVLTNKLAEQINLPSKQVLLYNMERNQSMLKALRGKVDFHKTSANAIRAKFYPTISAFGNVAYNAQSDSQEFSQLNTVSAVGIQINFKIYDHGRISTQYRHEILESRVSEQQLLKAKRQLSLDIHNMLETTKTLTTILHEIDDAIQLADRSYSISLKRFETGKTSPLELNDVESALTSLKEKRLEVLLKLNQAFARIEKITGVSYL